MATTSPVTSADRLSDDALIELVRSTESRHLARIGTTGMLAGALALVALLALLLPAQRAFSPVALAVCIAAYTLAARVQFEFGTGFALPTEVVFVSMWFLLPPQTLPLAVCGSMVLAQVPELVRGRMPPDRLALDVAAAWYTVGPMIVLLVAGAGEPHWTSLPVYAGALAAQFAFDFGAGYVIARPVLEVTVYRQLRMMAPAFAVDTLLAPLGLLVAFAVHGRPAALLLVVPMLVLFARFAGERQRRIDHALELSSAYRGTAILLGDVIEADDAYTGSHSRDVVELSVAVADTLGLTPEARDHVEFAALLHDVGKVKVPPEIINKPGPLDAAEKAVMDRHTLIGEEMLDTIGGLLGEVGRVVRSCHEHWDGAGYPDGLAGEQIPLAARVVCACDAWSAMTTDRPYRPAQPVAEAATELRASAGTHFDPRVVEALLGVLEL